VRDAAGSEQLEEVGAVGEVLARAAADLVDAVERRLRAAVAVAGSDPARGDHEVRALQLAGVERLARVDVEPVLLGHDPHRRRARGEIGAQVVRHAQGLATRRLAQLAELIAAAGHDRQVRVRVDQARHHEPELDHLAALRRRAGDEPAVLDDQLAGMHRLGPRAVEQRLAADHDDPCGRRGNEPSGRGSPSDLALWASVAAHAGTRS
jgi:hypothetical protein